MVRPHYVTAVCQSSNPQTGSVSPTCQKNNSRPLSTIRTASRAPLEFSRTLLRQNPRSCRCRARRCGCGVGLRSERKADALLQQINRASRGRPKEMSSEPTLSDLGAPPRIRPMMGESLSPSRSTRPGFAKQAEQWQKLADVPAPPLARRIGRHPGYRGERWLEGFRRRAASSWWRE